MYDDRYDYRDDKREFDRGPDPDLPGRPVPARPPREEVPEGHPRPYNIGRIFPFRTMTQLATFGVMIFFVGFIVSNIWLIYEEPQAFEYEYDEYEEYEKDHAEYEHAVRGTMGVGRVLSGIGLIMLGGALFAGGISESTIPENIRRAMVHGGALIIIMTLFVMMLFAWIVV